MTAPGYVPSSLGQQPRRGLPLPPAKAWRATRPGDLGPAQPTGPHLGSPGPDQGYALTLARRFEGRVVVGEGEHEADAVAGCIGVALKRASLFGRAPVIHDLELAYGLWGFLEADPPAELVAFRRSLFEAASHDYWDQRDIVDRVPETTLRRTPEAVRRLVAEDWRTLF